MADGLSAANWTFVVGETRCPRCAPQAPVASQVAATTVAVPSVAAPSGGALTAAAPWAGASSAVASHPAATDSPYGRAATTRAERAGIDPDAAVRARINAGVLDVIIVGLCTGLLLAILGIPVGSLDAAGLILGCQFVYFFLLESRPRSSPGKARYGLTVVTLDGERPGAGALAIRNALRVIDSFPIFYASGLLSLMRTGRPRRQRIGDLLAGTTVVSTDPTHHGLRTPGWLLPAACSFALLLAGGLTFGVFGLGSSRKLNSADEASFVGECSRAGARPGSCACVFETLRDSYGVDTPGRLQDYFSRIHVAEVNRDPAQIPAGYVATLRVCRGR
jgi:uncharacterized RDD family membrane protein YckC